MQPHRSDGRSTYGQGSGAPGADRGRSHAAQLHHARAQDSLLEAFQVMHLARLRLLPVVREDVLVVVVGFGDVLRAVLDQLHAAAALARPALQAIPVERVMTAPLETLGPDALLAEAARRLCRTATGCVPVVEAARSGPRLLGLVVESDLLRAFCEAPSAT